MTRRRFLKVLTGLAALVSSSGPAAAGSSSLGKVRISGPAVAETLPLLVMSRQELLPGVNRGAEFIPWHSPDQLRALVATAGVDAALMTTATACTLHNKGIPCTVVALLSSPVWLVSTDESLSHLRELDGQDVFLPFGPGEMPDLLLQALAAKAGVRFVPKHVGNALEAVNLMLLGRGRHALLGEPAATLAISRARIRPGRETSMPSKRLDIRDAWKDAFTDYPDLLHGALAVVGPQAADAAVRANLGTAYAQAANWVVNHPREAAGLAGEDFPALGSQAVNGVLPGTDIRMASGPHAEASAWFFLSLLHGLSPASIGGRLPEPALFEVGA